MTERIRLEEVSGKLMIGHFHDPNWELRQFLEKRKRIDRVINMEISQLRNYCKQIEENISESARFIPYLSRIIRQDYESNVVPIYNQKVLKAKFGGNIIQ